MTDTHADPGRWDREALTSGAGVTLVFAVPLTVLASVVGSDSGGLNAFFFFGALLGFVLGAGCAAWIQRRGTPLSHGLATAAGTYLIAQAVFVAIRILTGRDINWLGVAFTMSLVLLAGIIGGVLGQRLQNKGFEPSRRLPNDRSTT
ncbi:MAG: hypothetical protein QNM02_14060 [Acidimicrobiia bacterium]|nr:hypothetical protein [Acidimicrobiia bacterium]